MLVEDVAASLNATKRFRGRQGARFGLFPGFDSHDAVICLPRSCLCCAPSRCSTEASSPTVADVRFPGTQMVKHWSMKRAKSLTHHQTRYQGPQSGDKWVAFYPRLSPIYYSMGSQKRLSVSGIR